jgi:multidrug efflux pump subunit AcrA (membrane-fusion protein)
VFISPVVSLNPDLSRTLTVKIRAKEGIEKFVAGMSADVVILVDEKEAVLFVPTEALVRDQYVYVIEQGRAAKREITRGISNWSRTEILEGVREGETLITSVSLKELQPDIKVRVVEELKGP